MKTVTTIALLFAAAASFAVAMDPVADVGKSQLMAPIDDDNVSLTI